MSGDRATVFVVDDDEPVCRAIAFLLRADGYTAETHTRALSFLEALDGRRAGCVVLDLRLPDLDGLEVVRRLRRRPTPPPVILMTGDLNLPVTAPRDGILAVLPKPIETDRLMACVEQAFREASPGQAPRGTRMRPVSAPGR